MGEQMKRKNSGLGIAGLILAIIPCTSFIGLILSIVDVCKKDGKKKTCAIIGIIIYALYMIVSLSVLIGGGSSTDATQREIPQENGAIEDAIGNDDLDVQDSGETENESLTIGSSFEKNGLKITVNDADLGFTDYEDEYGLYKPKDGTKYIMVSFTFENNGDSDAYVSIYDFNCYADNTACEQAYLPDGSDFINANISSGRNISFQTYYTVPIDAQSIELEYETSIWTGEKAIIKLQ